MKLLITGGAGFIGSNFILYWLKNYPEESIVNLDKLTYAGNLENLKSVKNNPNYQFIKGDIKNPEIVEKAMEGADCVVHFAAESHVDRSIKEPAVFIETNIIGTQVLLDMALKKGIKRFHHISTDEVFGPLALDDQKKFNEATPYNPQSPYAASKASSDHLVRSYGKTYRLPYSISNCSNNFGPFQYPEKFIPLAIVSLLSDQKVPVYGDGKYVRDWLYVEDHCRAIDLIIRNDATLNQTFCVGGTTYDISNIEVVKKILSIFHKDEKSIEYVPDRPGHDRRYAVDWAKIKKELDWQPKYDFDTYLKKTIDWYISHQDWWHRLLKKNNMRIYHG